jgi:hypothetical protein
MTRTTIVVHPDGSTSKRTSKTKTYTWAVVCQTIPEALAAEKAAQVAGERAQAASAHRAADARQAITEARSWFDGRRRVSAHLVDPLTGARHYVGAWVTDAAGVVLEGEHKPSLSEAVAKVRAAALEVERRADELEARPASRGGYSVVRWSSSYANAAKALRSREFAYWAAQGHVLSVVEVEEVAR